MSVLTIPQAKDHLNLTSSTNDAEVQAFIDAAEAALTRVVGPLASTTVTAKVSACGPMSLPTTPAISLTSITDSGGAVWSLTGVAVTPEGTVYGATFPGDIYTVVYTAGRSTLPADLLLAVKELLRHLWATQRGVSSRPGSAPLDSVPGAAYTLPIRVQQLIAPHMQIGV